MLNFDKKLRRGIRCSKNCQGEKRCGLYYLFLARQLIDNFHKAAIVHHWTINIYQPFTLTFNKMAKRLSFASISKQQN